MRDIVSVFLLETSAELILFVSDSFFFIELFGAVTLFFEIIFFLLTCIVTFFDPGEDLLCFMTELLLPLSDRLFLLLFSVIFSY